MAHKKFGVNSHISTVGPKASMLVRARASRVSAVTSGA